MNFKYFIPFLFFSLILISCTKDTKEMLIGKWQVDQVKILEAINPAEKQDLERMKGAVINFMKNGNLQIKMEGNTDETQWSLSENILKIENGIEFEIREITETNLILKGELFYYEEGEMLEYGFTQHMSKQD